MSKLKALVIIAHPDDETLWMGGTLLRLKNEFDLTIVCVTQTEKDKAGKVFKRVCEQVYNAKPVLLGCPDIKKDDVLKKLVDFDHKVVFTHNACRSPQHLAHIKVHDIVKTMNFEKVLTFWSFLDDRKYLADKHTHLTKQEKETKCNVLKQYPYTSTNAVRVLTIAKNMDVERFLIPENKKDSVLYKFCITCNYG